MKQKTVVAALALITAQAGLPSSVAAQDSQRWEQQCSEWRRITDTSELQAQLEYLLLNRPEDPCIDYLVGILGGPPRAGLGTEGDGEGDGVGDGDGTGGVITVSY